MSNFDGTITADPAWVDIPQLSAVCKALGGAGGPMNAQAVAIAARLGYLAQAIDAINTSAALLTGTTYPDDAVGENGDIYLDTASTVLYGPKAAGTWPGGIPLVGPGGMPGPPGSGALLNIAVFDIPGTYTLTVPAGTFISESWGAGGGGGRFAAPDGSGNYYKGGGGGGGSYVKAIVPVAESQELTITVGAKGIGAGTGARAGLDSGSNGGSSSVSLSGGAIVAGGGSSGSALNAGGGGIAATSAGTTGAAFAESVHGQRGQDALLVASSSSAQPSYYSGNGGDGAKGGAGGWGRRSQSNSSGDDGMAGVFPGGGGGGADEMGDGGDGADGKVVIWY